MVAHIIDWLLGLPTVFKILIVVTLIAIGACFWLSWHSSKLDLNGSEVEREYEDESNGDD